MLRVTQIKIADRKANDRRDNQRLVPAPADGQQEMIQRMADFLYFRNGFCF